MHIKIVIFDNNYIYLNTGGHGLSGQYHKQSQELQAKLLEGFEECNKRMWNSP